MIQLLPVNDTTSHMSWRDSYPYSGISVQALHPLYLHLPDVLNPPKHGTPLPAAAQEVANEVQLATERLRTDPETPLDYDAVLEAKSTLLHAAYQALGSTHAACSDYADFVRDSAAWLRPYALFRALRDKFGHTDFSQWGRFATVSPVRACIPPALPIPHATATALDAPPLAAGGAGRHLQRRRLRHGDGRGERAGCGHALLRVGAVPLPPPAAAGRAARQRVWRCPQGGTLLEGQGAAGWKPPGTALTPQRPDGRRGTCPSACRVRASSRGSNPTCSTWTSRPARRRTPSARWGRTGSFLRTTGPPWRAMGTSGGGSALYTCRSTFKRARRRCPQSHPPHPNPSASRATFSQVPHRPHSGVLPHMGDPPPRGQRAARPLQPSARHFAGRAAGARHLGPGPSYPCEMRRRAWRGRRGGGASHTHARLQSPTSGGGPSTRRSETGGRRWPTATSTR